MLRPLAEDRQYGGQRSTPRIKRRSGRRGSAGGPSPENIWPDLGRELIGGQLLLEQGVGPAEATGGRRDDAVKSGLVGDGGDCWDGS